MMRRDTKDDDTRALADACLVSVMSYCGLRPGEALALTWSDISNKTLLVDKAIVDDRGVERRAHLPGGDADQPRATIKTPTGTEDASAQWSIPGDEIKKAS